MSMRNTFRVLYYLKKGKETADGTVMIMARITVNGEVCQFSTKQKVKPSNWSKEMNRAIGRSSETVRINLLLDEIKGNIFRVYQEMLMRDNYVTAEKVRNAFVGNKTDCTTLLQLFNKNYEDMLQLQGKSVAKATLQKYKTTQNHIQNFIKHKYNISDIYVKEITPMFIRDFEVYMLSIGKCGVNTTAHFLQLLKRIVSMARENGLLLKDPFVNHKIRLKKVDRGYLNKEEIARLAQKEFGSERLEQVRDIFVFSCFTGLAYIDLKNLTEDNIIIGLDGNQWINTHRQKTDTKVVVPLMSIPKMILEKYKGKLKNGQILPVISNQKTNCYLKEIADICGIKKVMTSHLARHTFATTTTLSAGVPIETVSRMLGHTNIATTQIYARITNEKISKDMMGLSDQYEDIEDMLDSDNNQKRKIG